MYYSWTLCNKKSGFDEHIHVPIVLQERVMGAGVELEQSILYTMYKNAMMKSTEMYQKERNNNIHV